MLHINKISSFKYRILPREAKVLHYYKILSKKSKKGTGIPWDSRGMGYNTTGNSIWLLNCVTIRKEFTISDFRQSDNQVPC